MLENETSKYKIALNLEWKRKKQFRREIDHFVVKTLLVVTRVIPTFLIAMTKSFRR